MTATMFITVVAMWTAVLIVGLPDSRTDLKRRSKSVKNFILNLVPKCGRCGSTVDAIDPLRPPVMHSQFDVCGNGTIPIWSQYVRGGQGVSARGSHPWLVEIFNMYSQFLCNGILLYTGSSIASDMILAVAECLHRALIEAVVIAKVGSAHKIIKRVATWSFFSIKNVPKRNSDLALIRLEEGITFGPAVKPVCLPDKGTTLPDNGQGIVAGLIATTSLKPNVPWDIWEASVKFIRSAGSSLRVQHNVRDPRGDITGSPLVVRKNHLYFLKAVAYTVAGHTNERMDIYTVVEPYLGWIRDRINQCSRYKS